MHCSNCKGTREHCGTCNGLAWRMGQEPPPEQRTYLLVRSQNSGCDYTIGCGLAVDLLTTTETMEELVARYKADALGDNESGLYVDGEWELSGATLYEVTAKGNLPLAEWKREKQRKDDEAAQAESNAKERAEFERLRQKFEEKP